MTKSEKVTFVINTLNELYPTIPIPLDHKDPYT
jgi:endonuclease-3